MPTYGNIRIGTPSGNPVYSVAVRRRTPRWCSPPPTTRACCSTATPAPARQELPLPQKAACAAVAPSDPAVLYTVFFKEGLRKSTDKGKTWQDLSQGFPKNATLHEVAVSPADPDDVFVIGADG